MEIKDAGLIRDQTVGDSTSRPPHYRDPCRDCHAEIGRLRKISDNWRQSTQDGLEVIRNLQTINDEQHTQINSLTARVWDAECKVIKISDVVGGTDPYYRSTVMESVAAIVTDIPVGSAIQKDGVVAELDSLRTNSEKWEREAHRLMEVITGNANDIERLTTELDEKNAEISKHLDIYAGMRAALDNQGRTRNNKIAEQKATIEELETANEAGRSAHQRLYQQNHNLVVMAEARNDRIAELESENDDLSRKLDVLPTNFWSVIGERDATIKQQKITIASLGRDLIEESKCNDEEWWAQECESLKDTIVSHEHTIDKLKADRDGWKLSLCDACDVIRRFKDAS